MLRRRRPGPMGRRRRRPRHPRPPCPRCVRCSRRPPPTRSPWSRCPGRWSAAPARPWSIP
ncbi:MAG: hypothetical protein FJ148_00250 [Deltaproteobacteria bacterium]|nr:hypothetical protein [Deltaproteobacteria bacterium]